MKAELAETVSALLGEGPQLFPDQNLRWVDLLRGEVYVRAAGRSRLIATHPHEVAKVLPWSHGHLALTRSGIEAITVDGATAWAIDLTGGDDSMRCSDGTVLPDGSVAVGIVDRDLTPGRGRLVRVLVDGTIVLVVDGATIPNGIDVTATGGELIWVESQTRTLHRFAINRVTGDLSQPRSWVTLPEEWGVPDGLCSDAHGGVWVAMWGGGFVAHLTANGDHDATISLPVDHVTSVAFDADDVLIITTASVAVTDDEGAIASGAGALWSAPQHLHATRGLLPRVSTLSPKGPPMTTTRDDLIHWLRHTTPESVVDEIIDKLDGGTTIDDLWAAGALTASKHVSNQARNLLGFVSHAMIGCEDARQAALGQPDDIQRLLLVQALAQVVVDLHDPCFAPYELLDVWGIEEASVDESIAQLRSDVKFGEWMRADHRIVGLERTMPRDEFIDLVLDIGLEGIVTDDHTLITPALSLDMMELTGWDAGFPMLRGTMRYSCTFPRNLDPYRHASELVDLLGLADSITEGEVDAAEAALLRTELLVSAPSERPTLVAKAIQYRSLNTQTIMSALSLAACDMYLQVQPVPHDDYDAVSREVAPIHIGTTLNILRASLPRMKNRTKALAVVMGGCLLERGPSVLNEDFEFIAFEPGRTYPYDEDIAPLLGEAPDALLARVHTAMFAHDARTTTAAVAAYHRAGGNAEELITVLVRAACTDDGTLMHNVKHLHSCLEEFRASTHPDRWNFLIAAARWISWYAGKDMSTYHRAAARLSPQPVSS